ncbi:hypothetical protein V2O64_13250 [Verrucomicrobiaceae bacterium 227]
MHLDLRKSARAIQRHIASRVRDYQKYLNEGPGDDDAEIAQIAIGFQFDQAGWLALVFDTRPGASPDGEWNSYIEPNAIEFEEWHDAFNSSGFSITEPNGTKKRHSDGATEKEFAEWIGSAIRDCLLSARDTGVLAKLPLADSCVLIVEEHDGYFGWSDAEPEDESDSDYLARLDGNSFSLPVEYQITHWLRVLDRIASGKESDSGWSFLAPDHAMERLEALGDVAISPMLKFVRKWSNKPEFGGDRPKRNIQELPMQTPTIDVLMKVHKMDSCVPEAERLLREIVRRSVRTNDSRKLWGIIPVWAARCLHRHFTAYPEPRQDDRTNRLLNHCEFTNQRRTSRG